jgi:uncharacterized protein involved in exopolysaccharide biosynthesis
VDTGTGASAGPRGILRDVARLWHLARLSWVKVAGLVAAFTAAAVAVALLTRPTYRAEVLLAPLDRDAAGLGGLIGQFGGLADMAGINLPRQNKRAASVATLKSRALTEAFITDNDLLPVLFPSEWDAQRKRWKSDDLEDQPTAWDAFKLMDGKIRSVQEDRRSGLIVLAIEWRDAKQCAQWANELVARANRKLQTDAIDEGERTIRFYNKELEAQSTLELRQLLYRLIEAETKEMALARARDDYAFQVIDPAVVPRKRIRPNRRLIVAAGFLLGCVASLGMLLLQASAGPAVNAPRGNR